MNNGSTAKIAEAPLPLRVRLLPRFIRRFSLKHWLNARAAEIARRLSMWAARDSNAVAFARAELPPLAGCEDDLDRTMQSAMNAHILEMVAVFSNEGHSGSSAAYARARIARLLDFKPLARSPAKTMSGTNAGCSAPPAGRASTRTDAMAACSRTSRQTGRFGTTTPSISSSASPPVAPTRAAPRASISSPSPTPCRTTPCSSTCLGTPPKSSNEKPWTPGWRRTPCRSKRRRCTSR